MLVAKWHYADAPLIVMARQMVVTLLLSTFILTPASAQSASSPGFLLAWELLEGAKQNETFALGYIIGALDATMPLLRTKGHCFASLRALPRPTLRAAY